MRDIGYFGGCVIILLQTIVQLCTAEVTIMPNAHVILAAGETHIYFCASLQQVENVEWLINGTSLNDLNFTDIVQEHTVTLRVSSVSTEYNNTRIQCIGGGELSVNSLLMVVQGLLSAVGSLMLDTNSEYININWRAPFTLDITSTDPDITYCVDVVSFIFSSTLHSECEIDVTEFTYPRPSNLCEGYNFTVIPVNLAGNGTEKTIQFPLLGPRLLAVITNYTTLSLLMSAAVCQVDELMLFDLDTGSNLTLSEANVTLSETTISINSQLLTSNRRYSLILSASNAGQQAISGEDEIFSTHDVSNCSASSSDRGVTVSVSFIAGSMATGVLLGVNFVKDNRMIDFRKSFFQVVEKSDASSSLTTSVDLWNPGQYVVNAYDIESDMRIDEIGYRATSCSVDVMSSIGTTPPSQKSDCSISSSLRAITVSCSFTSFQALAQLNVQNSVGTLHVNTSEDSQTTVTLYVPDTGEYLVTVLPFEDGMKSSSGVVFSQILMVTDVLITTIATTTATQSKTIAAVASIGVPMQPLPISLYAPLVMTGLQWKH